jgi:hypothetical protein
MELNPNHPTTTSVREQWHKLCALLMVKLGTDHVVITPNDIERLVRAGAGRAIVVQELADGLHLRMVDQAEADRLAREHGGRPT